MEAINNDKNNVPILRGRNTITYFVDKSSIKRIEENQFIYKVQAVVYEVENNNSRRTNPYIHKVLVTYRYDINHSVASVLRTPQYAQDYSRLIYAKQANSGMKLTINSVEDFNYEGFNRFGYSDEENEYFKNKFNIKEPYNGESTTKINEKSIIYPYYYFCTPRDNFDNFSIHHFNGSWKPSHERKDKFNLFNRFIISRFKKKGIGDLPITQNEKILFSIRLSNLKSYVLIKIKD